MMKTLKIMAKNRKKYLDRICISKENLLKFDGVKSQIIKKLKPGETIMSNLEIGKIFTYALDTSLKDSLK